MGLGKLGSFLAKKGVPLLGSVIGGPAGAIVGQLVAPMFGANADDEDDLIRSIEADPEATVKLKQIEAQNKERLEELNIERERIALEDAKAHLTDVQSARTRDVAIVEATGKRDIHLYMMAWIIIVGFMGLAVMMIFKAVPENQIVTMMFGALIMGFSTVLAYFFGSSKGSADKTKMSAVK